MGITDRRKKPPAPTPVPAPRPRGWWWGWWPGPAPRRKPPLPAAATLAGQSGGHIDDSKVFVIPRGGGKQRKRGWGQIQTSMAEILLHYGGALPDEPDHSNALLHAINDSRHKRGLDRLPRWAHRHALRRLYADH